MCTASGPSEVVVPSIAPRDTSDELIKSNYALSEENKKKNAEIMAARNKAKSLVSFDDKESPTGNGTSFGDVNQGSGLGGTGTGALGMDIG